MALGLLILVLTSLGSLLSWDEFENSPHTLFENWGLSSRVKRAKKIEEQFPGKEVFLCDMLHETSEAPFAAIVLFRTSGRFLCMGSIIDQRHILTAKRCFEKVDGSDLLVLLGYYRAYWGRHAQVHNVEKVLRHEYELAMLRLKRAINYTKFIQPVRLPASYAKVDTNYSNTFPPPYQLVGFDIDRYNIPADYLGREMTYKVKEDNFVPWHECRNNYTKIILDANKLFCTFGNATYCWGGWGAPVLKRLQDNHLLQVGVVISDNCTADSTGPLLVARTDVFGVWIRGNSFHGHHLN